MRLKDKVAIITGGGSGFGEGIARRFAAEGARIVVNDINVQGGERVANTIKQHGGSAVFVKADIAKATDVKALVKAALDAFGRVDIMVNNAGYTHRNQSMMNVDEAAFDRIFDVNVKAIYLAALEIVPVFRKQGGGAILNTASTAGAAAAAGPDDLQRVEGRRDHDDQVDGGRVRSRQDPRQLPLPGRGRDRDARRFHGR